MAPLGPAVVTTSEVFDSYQEDFRHLQRLARDKASVALAKGGSSTSRMAALREASEAHERAGRALQQMELETKSMGKLGASITPRLKDYRSQLGLTTKQVRDTQAALQREGLGLEDPEQKAVGDSYNRLRSTTKRLDDARRTALEAEEVSMDVMCDLHSQREGILRTKGHLQDVDDTLGISRRILQTLGFRVHSNQLMLGCIAFVLSIIVAAVFYMKMQKLASALR